MIRHFLKISFRNMWKHSSYTAINLFGLIVGLTCCIIITLYVLHEDSYDKFHEKSDRIYRVLTESPGFGLTTNSSNALYDELQQHPDVVSAARVFRHWFQPLISKDKETGFVEEQFFYADTTFFDVFSVQAVAGDVREGLRKPLNVLLTESTAKKYFGSENPIGHVVRYNAEKDFTVAGIIKDFPVNSHFRPDFVASMSSTTELFWPRFLNSWGQMVKTYLVVNDPARVGALESALTDIYPKRFGKDNATKIKLQPLTSIHLQTPVGGDFGPNNDMMYVRLLAILGIVILIISLVNYMNLTAARGMTRAKEVGIRKAIGVKKSNLILQFLSESVLLSVVAMILAVGLVESILPLINDTAQIGLSLSNYSAIIQIPILAVSAILIGLLGGIYPALIITRFDAVAVLKGTVKGITGARFRQTLVVLQFSASVILIFATIVIYQQMKFVQESRLGYTQDAVAVIPLKDSQAAKGLPALKQEWQRIPGVASVGLANAMPGKAHAGDYLVRDGFDKDVAVSVNWIDEGFLPVMEIPIAAGRNVSPAFTADEENSILI
ncbi:ABC transporter permease, partial [bacterium]|nr:ABC transporter permease [bacterium]